MAIAFANGAGVWVTIRPAAGQAFGPIQQLAPPGGTAPSIDLAINGAGYLAWSQGGDVRSAYLAARRGRRGRPIPRRSTSMPVARRRHGARR